MVREDMKKRYVSESFCLDDGTMSLYREGNFQQE